MPLGVVFVRVDEQNGLLATPQMVGARFEAFVEGTEPKAVSSRSADGSDGLGEEILSPENGRLPEGMFE